MIRKPIFILAAVIIAIVIFLISGEVIIRFEGLLKGSRIWTPDKYLKIQHIPNTLFRNIGYYKEYKAQGRVNRWGFIGRDINLKKPKDIYRIAVLGDSFTEAIQVDMDKNFCSLLEQLLEKNGKKCEVINAAISDYSPKLEYLYLRERLLYFEPDVVVLQLFANDVYDDYKDKDLTENTPSLLKKSFVYNHSRLYHYVLRQRAKILKKVSQKRDKIEEPGIDRFFFIKKGNPGLKKELWATTAENISKIKNLTGKNNIRLIIFIVPLEAQVSLPGGMSTASQFYFKEPPTDDFDTTVRAFCKSNNLDYIDMLPVFRDNKKLNLYFEKEGHLTEIGHRLVAETLFEYLKSD